jgi:hypothetical protein
MKLPEYKRIYESDYPENEEFVRNLSIPINSGFESAYQALDNNITLSDNISGVLRTINLDVNSNGVPKQPIVLDLGSPVKVIGISVLRVENLTSIDSFVSGAPFISYEQNSNLLTIRHITGLLVNNRYQLTMFAFRE